MSNNTIQTRIKNKTDTSTNWTSKNPVLLKGEVGYESDTGKSKLGDGTTAWTSLAYTAVNSAPTLAWNTTSTIGKVNGVNLTVKLPANPNSNSAHAHTAGSGLKISGGGGTSGTTTYSVNTDYTTSGKNYKVAVDSTSGGLYVNVPWTDTTYTFNGAVSTIKDNNLTASRALVSDANGKVAVSAVTSTELGYLDGVTSAIQTQLNEKVILSESFNGTGEIVVADEQGSVKGSGYSISDLAEAGHTHTTSIAESSGTSQVSLAHGKKYALNAGGTSYIFSMPSDNNTNYYHKTGTWSGLTYTAAKVGSPDDLAFTIPTGTTSTTVALGNHTHDVSIAASSGTNELTLAHGTKYALTAGGQSFVFTMPSDSNTHHTAYNYVGAADAASNAATNNGSTYLKLYENGTKRSQFLIKGEGATTVTSDASGNITISSTNSVYDDTSVKSRLTTLEGKPGLDKTGTVTSVKVGTTSYSPSSGVVSLPAYPSVPSSLKNPNAVTIQAGGATVSTYDGSAAKTFNIAASTTAGAFTISDGTTTKTVQLTGQFTDNNTITKIGMVGNSTLSPVSGDIIFNAGTNVSLAHQYSGGQQNITINAVDTTYTTATTSALGLVKSTTTGTTSGRDYAVQVNSDGTMKVNVPWTDTNTNTTNTTGTTEKASTKLFLAGATSQASAPQTFSNAKVYIGTDNCLYSNSKKVVTQDTFDSLAQTVDELPTFDYVDDEIATVTAIANGKTRTYVLSYTPTDSSCNGNSVFNSNNDTIDLSQSHKTQLINGTILNMSTGLKIGDIILVKETNVPDRWVMSVNGQGTFTLAKMETSKVDLEPYSENTHTHSVPAPTITVTGQSYTPAGSVSSSFTGTAATISVSGTPAGTIKTGTGTANYTPAGSVSTPTITVTPNTTTIKEVSSVGTLPSLTTTTCNPLASATLTAGTTPPSISFANGVLTISTGTAPSLSTTAMSSINVVSSWSAGSLPSTKDTTVATGIKSATSTQPSFTGTGTQLVFTGSSLTSTGSYTPKGSVSSTWTGTATTIKPTVTASGTTTGKAST